MVGAINRCTAGVACTRNARPLSREKTATGSQVISTRLLRGFLVTQETLHGGATDRTGSLHGVSAIFHGHLVRILHVRLLFTLNTIGFSHLFFLSYPQTQAGNASFPEE